MTKDMHTQAQTHTFIFEGVGETKGQEKNK